MMKNLKHSDLKTRNLIKIGIVLLLAAVFFFVVRKPEAQDTSQSQTLSMVEAAREAQKSGESQAIIDADGKKSETTSPNDAAITVEEDGVYTDKEHVALYLHIYGRLPINYVTKTKAMKAGWKDDGKDLWDVLPGMSIGGGPFMNNEHKLPEKEGREYKECDLNYQGEDRGAERLVYSNDGLIYYTGDHYQTFQLVYGEP